MQRVGLNPRTGSLAVLLAAAAFLWWILPQRSAPSRSGKDIELPKPAALAAEEPFATRAPLENTTPAEDATSAAPESARLCLAEYWGPRWSAIESALVAEGLDLDRPFRLKAWEAVAPDFERAFHMSELQRTEVAQSILDWPGESPLDVLCRELALRYNVKTLEEKDALAAQDLAVPFNQEIAALGSEYLDAVDQILQQRFRTGAFVKAPFSTIGVSRPEDQGGFYAGVWSQDGWNLMVALKREDYPYPMDLWDRAQHLVDLRDREVRRYLIQRGY